MKIIKMSQISDKVKKAIEDNLSSAVGVTLKEVLAKGEQNAHDLETANATIIKLKEDLVTAKRNTERVTKLNARDAELNRREVKLEKRELKADLEEKQIRLEEAQKRIDQQDKTLEIVFRNTEIRKTMYGTTAVSDTNGYISQQPMSQDITEKKD